MFCNVTLQKRPEVKGKVAIVLKNGCTLTANKGITVEKGNSISIYAQSDDESVTGRLNITAPDGQTAIGGRNGADGYALYDSAGKQLMPPGSGATAGSVRFIGGKSILSSTNSVTVDGGSGGIGGKGFHNGATGANGSNATV